MSKAVLPDYLQALGLSSLPFPVTPDQEGFFFSAGLTRQFAELCHFIELRKGFMLVSGDVGVGKSTLARLLLSQLESDGARSALVFNTFLQGSDLLRAIIRDFGIQVSGNDLEARLQALNSWLLEQHAAGHNCVLILDDAQALDVSSLELVRQLSNLETSNTKLLQIVMVAQPEINDTLARHDLRQLASRLALRLELNPLSLEEVDHYLHHRLQLAGNAKALSIDSDALSLLHQLSQGYIRRLHLLMDRCLFGLAAREQRKIDKPLLKQAARELGLLKPQPKVNWHRYINLPLLALCVGASAYVWQVQPAITRLLASATSVAAVNPVTAPEWDAFISAYEGVNWSGPVPTRWQDIHQVALKDQNWFPVRLPKSTQLSCQNQPSYALGNHRLALFKTSLPTGPVAFGTISQPVLMLQTTLAEIGLLDARSIDGQMGPLTAAALASFQQQQLLEAGGQPDLPSAYLLTCIQEEGEQDV